MKIIPACLFAILINLDPCYSASCSVSCPGFNFGNYTSQTPTPTTLSSTVSVTCQAPILGLLIPFSVVASTGNSGTYNLRTMQNSTHNLNYNVYLNPSLSTVFGNGAGSSSGYSGSILLSLLGINIPSTHNRTIYASVPGGQTVPTGTYIDTITLTVTF
jgi:spore coat protein U-like protein